MRNVTSILRDIDTVEKSKHLNEAQKAHAIRMFKEELGQATLPFEDAKTGGVPPAPQGDSETRPKTAKAS